MPGLRRSDQSLVVPSRGRNPLPCGEASCVFSLRRFFTFTSPTRVDRPCLTSSSQTQSEQQLIQEAKAVLERRLFQRGPKLASPQDAIDYLQLTMTREDREVFTVIFLDTRHRVIAVEPLFFGTIDGAPVMPRVILHRALLLNGAAIIAAHNHPSGDTVPSDADRTLTTEVAALLRRVDIRLLDHLIIGQGEPFSFAQAGLL